MNAKVRKISRK